MMGAIAGRAPECLQFSGRRILLLCVNVLGQNDLDVAGTICTQCSKSFLTRPAHIGPMPLHRKHFEREVRRARHWSALLIIPGRADQDCQVMDISQNGAKVIAPVPSEVPARFEIAFFQNSQKRQVCEVVWRRGKTLGVKFPSDRQ